MNEKLIKMYRWMINWLKCTDEWKMIKMHRWMKNWLKCTDEWKID